jgi:hypothetical protein
MTERKLSALQKEYRYFFLQKLKLYGVTSPAHLTKEKKSEFFTSIKLDWARIKESRKFNRAIQGTNQLALAEEPTLQFKARLLPNSTMKGTPTEVQSPRGPSIKQIIRSEPNAEQTDDLKILFQPNNHFSQAEPYAYPVVKMPKANSSLKLPRTGRSNQKGFKESDFCKQIRASIDGIQITDNVHMVIPNFKKPYEPDIVLFDKILNLYIDIEIDEPYDGYYRYPTHYVNPEDEVKQDDVRDLFFNESGWIVIRFTEKQIHLQPYECIAYIKNVLSSIYHQPFSNEVKCQTEEQWDYNQCIQWQKFYYRENYLGIERFQKQYSHKEILIDDDESESIEEVIQRTKKFNTDNWSSSIAFDEESHKYLHPKDATGNAEYISVTTLIERFFPFDLKRYIEKKAEDENRTEEEVLDEYLLMRDEAAERGTFLHNQIENYLKQKPFDSNSKEFGLFLEFYNKEITPRNLIFSDAEKIIFSNLHNLAGTIDCLFKKSDQDEYVMLDWKRSKKLIIDGRPRKFGYGYALSELNLLDNSSYYRYCLQQNLYKHIIETEYEMKISSMKLVVLHENYNDYHIVVVPIMKNETNIILNSLKVKI